MLDWSMKYGVAYSLISCFAFKFLKETRMVQNRDRPSKYRNNIKLKIYIKLSIVMGITWVIGYTIEYSTFARYLYVLLNTFQG